MLFNGLRTKRFQAIESVARRKLRMLDSAKSLNDLAMIPGSRMEALKGGSAGQNSIRVNDQYRVCFIWRDGGVDYH